MPHLLTPIEPVQRTGPLGGPIAVHTKLGWSLQGPTNIDQVPASEQQCLFTVTDSPTCELFKNVERLWQIDTLPYTSQKQVTRSKQDQQALALLQSSTVRVTVDGIQRYATPLLRRANSATLQAPMETVLSSLRSTERRLAKDPQRAEVYCQEIKKLERMGYVAVVPPEVATSTPESWFIPHHMVQHNNKDRIVFNCSFQYKGKFLNDLLLPGPALGPSLLGVLIQVSAVPSSIPTQKRKLRMSLIACASYSTPEALKYASGPVMFLLSSKIFHPTSDLRAVSYGFPNTVQTCRSQLLGYVGIAFMTP
ncbi:hypothetical protein L3Q82_016771 [Scortum barcoo]|uniref:Uncharacterized protein n=1 Tax=Scortum barcoo TaxID=214431 RepID=A0ACB8X820_9TELE|nr:hypothetical protein L3Q82_016771 [Scortum barcoo]